MPVNPPPGSPGTNRIQQIQAIAEHIITRLEPKYGTSIASSYASDYESYAYSHPNLSATQAYLAWFLIKSKINSKLGHDIAGTLGNAGKFAQKSLNALGPAFGKFDIFNGINFGNWLMRGGEILIGLVLIGVGVAKLTGTQNIISKIAKVPL